MNKHVLKGTMITVVMLSFFNLIAFSQQSTNVDIVSKMYNDVATGDIPSFLGAFDENIEWNEAENFPYADGNPYIGPDAVVKGVFERLGAEWEYFNVVDLHVYDMADNMVLATGRYDAKHKTSGKEISAQCAHLWTLKDNKAVKFQQYTDTKKVNEAMQTELGLTYKEILGKTLDFDFGSSVIEITYVSDTLHTFKYKNSDAQGQVIQETIHIDPYSTHITWIKENGTVWSAFNNFKKGKVTVFNIKPDGEIKRMVGTMSLPE